MSYQTTMAHAEANAWDDTWRKHKAGCPPCSLESRRRRWDKLCAEGQFVIGERRAAKAALERERQLDREPPPRPGRAVHGRGDDMTPWQPSLWEEATVPP